MAFVNVDTIAAGLAAFAPETAAIAAGRILLGRIADLARQRQDFAFRNHFGSSSFLPFLRRLQQDGYRVRTPMWLRSPELSV